MRTAKIHIVPLILSIFMPIAYILYSLSAVALPFASLLYCIIAIINTVLLIIVMIF